MDGFDELIARMPPTDPDTLELTRRLIPLCLETGECPTNMLEVETLFGKDPETRAWFNQYLINRVKLTKEYGYAYGKYPHNSSAADPGCKEECSTCNSQYLRGSKMENLPYLRCLTDAEAREHLNCLRTSTDANIAQLRTYVDQFGDTVFRRWQKWTIAQRTAHLQKAMFNIYRHKGGVLREADQERPYDRRFRNLYLLPWLNAEVLSEDPARLGCLLHARTTYSQLEWTDFDDHQLDYAFRLWMVDVIYNPHCVGMHGPRFGELVSWDSAKFHRHAMISYPRAALIFEAQNVLSCFLRDVVSLMVDSNGGGWQASGKARLTMLATTGSFSSKSGAFPDLSCATPYTKPSSFDMQSAFDALQGRLRAAEDELWIMQTDPAAVHDHLARIHHSAAAQHCDPQGLKEKIVRRVMLSLQLVEDWQYLMDEVILIKTKVDKYSSSVARGAPLPKVFEEAIGALDYLLRAHIEALGRHLGHLILSSGSFSHGGKTHVDERGFVFQGSNREVLQDPNLFHLVQLRIHHDQYSLPIAFDVNALEDHFAKCPKDAGRVDQMMWNIISDMALVDDILTTVRLHRPRAAVPKGMVLRTRNAPAQGGVRETVDPGSAWKWAQQVDSQYLKDLVWRNYAQQTIEDAHAVGPPEEHPYIRLYKPLQHVFELPIPSGKPNRDKLAALDEFNAALRVFWDKVKAWRAYQLGLIGVTHHFLQASQHKIFVVPRLGLEDPWEKERASLLAAIIAEEGRFNALQESVNTNMEAASDKASCVPPAGTELKPKPPPSSYGILNKDTEPQRPKEKIKTRATPVSADITEDLAGLTVSEPVRDARSVTKTSLAVFTRTYEPLSDAKATRWVDFTAALADAGFV